jgi:hypothetical protein
MRILLRKMLQFLSQDQQMNKCRVAGRQWKKITGNSNIDPSLSELTRIVSVVLEERDHFSNIVRKT